MNRNHITSVQDIQAAIQQGFEPTFLFFWGHRPRPDRKIGKSCLSQWWPSPFVVDGIHYPTAEHYMMAEKARLFQDAEMLANILSAPNPKQAKRLGRKVKGFSKEVWEKKRYPIVVRGNIAKFEQNATLKTFLVAINEDVLVEASPTDRIWGIGLSENHPSAKMPSKWRGLNLLGFALMEVRAHLMLS